jgi:hypothetical protein
VVGFFRCESTMPRTIRALSFDADNCLFHRKYKPNVDEILSGQCQQVITKNKALLEKLNEENCAFDETVVLVGSLRQSHEVDILNAVHGKTESIFHAIRSIATELNAILDKFLLADIYTNQPAGSTFDCAEQQFDGCASQEFVARDIERLLKDTRNCSSDTTKASMLYAQIHKLAMQYPDDKIVFDFYDDKDDILQPLMRYFEHYPVLLPKQVTLRLNHYDGKEVTLVSSIQGTGYIDENYRNTTQEIASYSRLGAMHLPFITPNSLSSRTPYDRLQHYLGSFFHHEVLELADGYHDDKKRLGCVY